MTYRSRTLLQSVVGIASLAALALFAYFGVYRAKQNQERDEKLHKQVLHFEPKQVTRLMVKNGDSHTVAERVTPEGKELATWRLTEPVKTDADNISVNGLLSVIERLESTQTIVGEDSLDRKRYGLDPPRGELQIQLQDGTNLGVLIGKRSSYSNDLYVQKEGDSAVQVVSGSHENALLKKTFDLRRKELMHFDTALVHKFILAQGKDAIELEKKDEAWRLAKPVVDTADSAEVTQLLDNARALRATEFIDSRSGGDKALGLDKPDITLKVFSDSDQVGQMVALGKATLDAAKAKYYAKSQNSDSLAEVTEYQYKNFQKTAFDFRERHLVRFEPEAVYQIKLASDAELVVIEKKDEDKPGKKDDAAAKEENWMLISPKSGPAKKAKIDELLSKLSQLKADQFISERDKADLSRYGLDKPRKTITLLGRNGSELGVLHIGSKAGET